MCGMENISGGNNSYVVKRWEGIIPRWKKRREGIIPRWKKNGRELFLGGKTIGGNNS